MAAAVPKSQFTADVWIGDRTKGVHSKPLTGMNKWTLLEMFLSNRRAFLVQTAASVTWLWPFSNMQATFTQAYICKIPLFKSRLFLNTVDLGQTITEGDFKWLFKRVLSLINRALFLCCCTLLLACNPLYEWCMFFLLSEDAALTSSQ